MVPNFGRENNKFEFSGYSGNPVEADHHNELFTGHRIEACLAGLADFLQEHPNTTHITHKIRRNPQLEDKICITYLTAWSKLWFFGKFFEDRIEELVRQDQYTWDLTTVTGLEMYCGFCIMRSMQEYPEFVYSHKDLDLSLPKQELGVEVMNRVYRKAYYGGDYLASRVGAGHHFWNHINPKDGISAEDRLASFKFDGHIDWPKQKPMIKVPYWNQKTANGGFINCANLFYPENTK